jgi:hypothetical protein
MQDQNLAAQLKSAEAEVANWRQKVNHINGSITAAQRVVDASEGRRAEFALAAATGDATATSAMRKVHQEDNIAKTQLVDLHLALVPTLQHRAAAEQVANDVRRALAREESTNLARKRIAAAARFDNAAAELEAAHTEYEALGAELHTSKINELFQRGYSLGTSVSQMEGLTGAERVKSALPPFFRRLFYTVYFGPYVQLSPAESAYWNIPVTEKEPEAA